MLYGAWDYWSKILRFGIDTEDLYVPRFILEALGGPDYVHEPVGIERWVPYLALPIGMALLLFRFVQATVRIALGKSDHLIAGHEAEDAVAEAQASATFEPHAAIGRASGRERVCQSVSISVVAVSLKKKHIKTIK